MFPFLNFIARAVGVEIIMVYTVALTFINAPNFVLIWAEPFVVDTWLIWSSERHWVSEIFYFLFYSSTFINILVAWNKGTPLNHANDYLNLTGYYHHQNSGGWLNPSKPFKMFTTVNQSVVITSNSDPGLFTNWIYMGPEYKVLANPISDETVEIYSCTFMHSWWVDNDKSCRITGSNGLLVGSIGHLFKKQVTTPFFTTAPLYLEQVLGFYLRLTGVVAPDPSTTILGYYIL